jgi:xylan 1,4-beta-xylosidase
MQQAQTVAIYQSNGAPSVASDLYDIHSRRVSMTRLLFVVLIAMTAHAAVTIEVDAAKATGPYKPIYAYFGYDEPNYTYTKNGRKLIGELAALSSAPVYIRTHFLLATGDGTPGLKWGSTNAYTEDASGKAIYDWTISDRILNTYLKAGAKPFVEIGFMPQALSSKPDPYHPVWVPGAKNDQYYIGWTYPPKDYEKWGALVNAWVKHALAKWGKSEVESWYWEVWNEPDIAYWHGTPEEYDKLYDYAARAVKQALPSAKVGGPASTSPSSPRAAKFLQQFLDHCAATGTPLDFITFHAKGKPEDAGTHIRMGMAKEVHDVQRGFEIVHSFPAFRNLPIILSEADPEGCAACSSRVYPQNAYRNGTLYPAYTAVMLKAIFDLADQWQTNIAGMLTWAFEFEDQPYFDGFRTLATNGIDKPVLNVFRMAGLMQGDRIAVTSSGRAPLEGTIKDVDALAARADRRIAVLLWNYQDDDIPGPPADIQFSVAGVPTNLTRVLLRHYRIDETHSNGYTVWKQQGSDNYANLEAAAGLQLLESPHWADLHDGKLEANFTLPLQATSLVELSW